jgi:hypothetical protein
VDSGIQINLNVNKEKQEGGININMNVNDKDSAAAQGGESLTERDMMRGEKLLAKLQGTPETNSKAKAARSTRVAQQRHQIHKQAVAQPMLHITTKRIPAKGSRPSEKIENFNFKVLAR